MPQYTALSSAISMGPANGKPQPTYDAVGRTPLSSSAISRRRRGLGAGKPTYVGCPQLCHQYAQTGAHGKPQPTYFILGRPLVLQSVGADKARRLESPVGRPQLCYQYAQAGPSGWKAPTTYLRRTLEAPTYLLLRSSTPSAPQSVCADGVWRLESPNISTSGALSSAISMRSRGPAAVKHLRKRQSTLPPVFADGARRPECPNIPLLALPSAWARLMESPNLPTTQ